MPTAGEIRRQTSWELERRSRLAVPAFAGGVLYLLGSIVINSTLKQAPTVGVLQGLTPAFSGVVNPAVSPRAEEVKFISHHSLPLLAGSVLAAVAILALMMVLLLLYDATSFRRPQTWRYARPLVLVGGISVAAVSVGHQVISAIKTHAFAAGHDFSAHAVDQALTKGTVNTIVDYVDLLAGLALAAGMITVSLNAQRVGLLTRWMGVLGMATALLIFLPIGGAELQVIPSFWMVMMGILLVGRWPNGDPPAWASGEARPWPSAAVQRAARRGEPAPVAAGNGTVPAPSRPTRSSPGGKRRRKRGSRG